MSNDGGEKRSGDRGRRRTGTGHCRALAEPGPQLRCSIAAICGAVEALAATWRRRAHTRSLCRATCRRVKGRPPCVETVAERMGAVDILVNNAG